MDKALFIIGNGFDIDHGLKSQYSNFRQFLIDKYPNIEKNCDRQFYIEDYSVMVEEEFAAEVILGAMNQASSKDWADFESALSNINFGNKLPVRSEEAKEIDDQNDIMGYLCACGEIGNLIIDSWRYWQLLFNEWVVILENQINSSNMKSAFSLLLNQYESSILTFNYTRTIQKMYNTNIIKHIHNRVGQQLIFGHGEHEKGYNPGDEIVVMSSDLDDFIDSLEKDTVGPLKKYAKFFNSISKEYKVVYSYGFSYSKVDSVYIKRIISKIAPDAKWLFTKYEISKKEEMRIKKVRLRNYGFKGEFGSYEI